MLVVVGVLPPEVLNHRTELAAPIMVGSILDDGKKSESSGRVVVGNALRDDAAQFCVELFHIGGYLLAEVKAIVDGHDKLGENVTGVGTDGSLFCSS